VAGDELVDCGALAVARSQQPPDPLHMLALPEGPGDYHGDIGVRYVELLR
jgi:hypothetical protein